MSVDMADRVAAPRGVNAGYQRDDRSIVDYRLWRCGDQALRGPAPDQDKPYFAVLGAAQIFGRFVDAPIATLLEEPLGLPALNLGFSGAGPSFFLQRPELIEMANRGRFAILHLMSGRSVPNSRLALGGNQGQSIFRDRPGDGPMFAEDAYRELVHTLAPAERALFRAEIRETYVAEMRELMRRITVPRILLYWSRRPVEYREGLGGLEAYWGDFPHFVNRDVIDQLRPLADRYVEVVGSRGLPQKLLDRETGAPVLMWPEAKFPHIQMREHNHYYPSPEMHADAAEALLPACREMTVRAAMAPAAGAPAEGPGAGVRDVLVHSHIFKNAGTAIQRSLGESFGSRLANVDPAQLVTRDELVALLERDADLAAISSHQLRLPLENDARFRFHPIVLLRHPLLRAQSVYEFERSPQRQQTSDAAHTRNAAERSFAEWVEWCLVEPFRAGPIANYQTRVCSNTNNGARPQDWAVPVSLQNYHEAFANLQHAHVGTVEAMDAFLWRTEQRLRPVFPGLRLLPYVENATWEPGVKTLRTLEAIEAELGPALYARLCAENALDLLLHRAFA